MTLISEDYKALQQRMHEQRADYGVASEKYGLLVSEVMVANGLHSLLDYGCGKGRLANALRFPADYEIQGQLYDPGNPRFDKLPSPRELVVCIDVLEHVERDCLNEVLDHIVSLTQRMVLFTIHTGPAAKTLPDGRNAHITQMQPEVWLSDFLLGRFQLNEASVRGKELVFIGVPYGDHELR